MEGTKLHGAADGLDQATTAAPETGEEARLQASRGPRLEGRVALVTGSDSGIGRAIALALAEGGADVVVTYHSDEDGGKNTVADIETMGRRALLRQLDVSDETSVRATFDAAEEGLGPVDLLVNNAGLQSQEVPLIDMSTEEFDRILKTDLYGAFFCCREFLRRRREETSWPGKIINITSVHERIPSPGNSAYGAAKGGLLTLTRSLALELAPKRINVNAIAPGQIRTPMTERTDDPEVYEEEMRNIPWRRPGEPWEVARLAAYLASSDADYVTGQSFTIDGGLQMNWGQGA
ncbi:oxidoreductase [Agaricicola taiwanensis]|uniref:Oxidoreductase n=1 Tax=Agaricicola taiwanensis TaxID=591372 RepID=A0A8J2YN86_9RHOB|nr:SDR family oxidoreductase [Agaricicola taiwanensis]GGE54045.1 oxidoreductase [Agaricicola taiwanensis]